ncbi:MAG: 50S ribosomal protein L4 [Lachnospiraceae bacterium]|nr:50S ribosomal protein L4 [Lachnospiraceae bacterium]
MANVSVYNMEGKEVGSMELNDTIFAAPENEHLVHMAVTLQLANKRQGTQKAKTRSEVRGGGRKPWRQKGTGHARQGSTRSPQWTGGGMVFAPVPRDYSFKMNKKEKAAAMKSVLSSKVNENKFIVVDDIKVDEFKTKKIVAMLDALNTKKAVIVLDDVDDKVMKSAANLKNVKTAFVKVDDATVSATISVYDILKYDTIVIAKKAVENIEEVYA